MTFTTFVLYDFFNALTCRSDVAIVGSTADMNGVQGAAWAANTLRGARDAHPEPSGNASSQEKALRPPRPSETTTTASDSDDASWQ